MKTFLNVKINIIKTLNKIFNKNNNNYYNNNNNNNDKLFKTFSFCSYGS